MIVAGTTGPLYFQLLDQGTPIDLTDFTVTLILTGSDGVDIATTGDVTIPGPVNGVVSYTPDSTDLTYALSPFKARWKLTEDIGVVDYIPSTYRDEWDVVPV